MSQQPTAEEEARTNVAAGKEEYAVEISPCTRFYDEWRQCTCTPIGNKCPHPSDQLPPSLYVAGYSRFHQYYIYGQFRSCAEQKERLRNCIKWRVSGSEHARVCT